jgi:hypothetical protein
VHAATTRRPRVSVSAILLALVGLSTTGAHGAFAETIEGDGYRVEIPAGFVRAEASVEAAGREKAKAQSAAVDDSVVAMATADFRLYVRPVASGGQEKFSLTRMLAAVKPADDPITVSGLKMSIEHALRATDLKFTRHGARTTAAGLEVVESELRGTSPTLGACCFRTLALPRKGTQLTVSLLVAVRSDEDGRAAWERVVASLRSDEPPPEASAVTSAAGLPPVLWVLAGLVGIIAIVLVGAAVRSRRRRA